MGLQLYLFMGVVKMSVWNYWWPTYATEDEANKERKKIQVMLCGLVPCYLGSSYA